MTNLKLIPAILLFSQLLTSCLPAVDNVKHAHYYGDLEGLVDGELRLKLQDIVSKGHIKQEGKSDELVDSCEGREACKIHKSLGYKTARKILFGKIHLEGSEGNYFIKDVYCLKDYSAVDFRPGAATPGPNTIPDHNTVNAEHVWPQSRFKNNTGKETDPSLKGRKKSDIHILYPSEHKVNGLRGNFEFGDVAKVTKESGCSPEARKGFIELGDDALSQKEYFEPPRESKGNVARSVFYFATRYNVPINDEEEKTLREWNNLDPVDEMEIRRNKIIHEDQGNRNPFIDMPTIVEKISNF